MSVGGGDIITSADMNRALGGSAEKPLCVLRRASGDFPISIANGGQVLLLNVETLDTHGWHSTSSNTSRITPTKAGWIRFSGAVIFTANATGRRGVALRKNGGTTTYGNLVPAVSATGTQNVGAVFDVHEQANGTTDYFEMFCYQDSGAALNITDAQSTHFSAEWIREL